MISLKNGLKPLTLIKNKKSFINLSNQNNIIQLMEILYIKSNKSYQHQLNIISNHCQKYNLISKQYFLIYNHNLNIYHKFKIFCQIFKYKVESLLIFIKFLHIFLSKSNHQNYYIALLKINSLPTNFILNVIIYQILSLLLKQNLIILQVDSLHFNGIKKNIIFIKKIRRIQHFYSLLMIQNQFKLSNHNILFIIIINEALYLDMMAMIYIQEIKQI